jgi:nitrite reductase (NADH) small subunit
MTMTAGNRVPVAKLTDFETVDRKHVELNGRPVCVFRTEDSFVAILNICPHAGGPVCRGKIDGTTLPSRVGEFIWGRVGEILVCPWHGREFDLRSGRALAGDDRLKIYDTAVEEDFLYLLD